MTFDPVEICGVLKSEGVEFVVIGGFAAIIHGSSLPTEDIDVIPSREWFNLERLARALKRLDAKIRTSGEPVETNIDAGFIASVPLMLNLVTNHGDLDLTFAPSGRLADYNAWRVGARSAQLRPVSPWRWQRWTTSSHRRLRRIGKRISGFCRISSLCATS